jgi:hypothetical protein
VATVWGAAFTAAFAILIILGSRTFQNFDAALVGYTFAVLFSHSPSSIATPCGSSGHRQECTGGAGGKCSFGDDGSAAISGKG